AREAEVINRGGEKISPVVIDNFLQSYPGIEDAAVFGVENKLGVAEVAAALVIPEDFDIPALQAALRAELNPVAVPQHLFRVNSVPRNQMGKPLRVQMAASFREQLVAAGRPGF
ncbi:MAG: acyl-CoA synthetase, partial [Thalassolituus sp.]